MLQSDLFDYSDVYIVVKVLLLEEWLKREKIGL